MRAEVEQLREENEALLSQLKEYQEGYRERLSEWNIERLKLQAQMNEEVERLRKENERLRADVEELTAENETLQHQLNELNERGAAQLPDLIEIRDRILKEWKLSRTSEKKARLWEFGERLIRAIEEALPDPDYTHLQRMRSDLEQLRKSQAASVRGAIQWEEKYREAQQRLDQRR